MDSDLPETDKARGRLTTFGWTISTIYLLCHVVYLLVEFDHILRMTPNEYGDFLAGIFAPLAFLWLVLGFFQQGKELRNSSQALNLQVRELRASVEQSERLVEVTAEQLALDRDVIRSETKRQRALLQPKIRLKKLTSQHSGAQHRFKFAIMNIGGECFDLVGKVLTGETGRPDTFGIERLSIGNELEVGFEVNTDLCSQPEIQVAYMDGEGEEHTVGFLVSVSVEDGQVRVNYPSIPRPITDY